MGCVQSGIADDELEKLFQGDNNKIAELAKARLDSGLPEGLVAFIQAAAVRPEENISEGASKGMGGSTVSSW